jgi:hypothetical protein
MVSSNEIYHSTAPTPPRCGEVDTNQQMGASKMPEFSDITNVKPLTDVARDAAYVAVGLGVLGLQKAQVHRVELKNKLSKDLSVDGRVDELRAGALRGVKHIDELVEVAFKFIESTLQPIEEQLPTPARDLAKRGHEQAREVHTHIRAIVIPA